MTKTQIAFRQINQETYLDLSTLNLFGDSFVNEFQNFTDEKAGFLSGASLGLILPSDVEKRITCDDEKLDGVLSQIRKTLNEKNISLREIPGGQFQEKSKLKKSIEKKKKEKGQETAELSSANEVFYYRANLRSGQEIIQSGDVVIFGDVNDSAQIIATGDVIVWGRLRGVVHAGANGNENALIAALQIDSCQLRISNKLVSLTKETRNNFLNKSRSGNKNKQKLIPQIAKIVDNEVQIFTSE